MFVTVEHIQVHPDVGGKRGTPNWRLSRKDAQEADAWTAFLELPTSRSDAKLTQILPPMATLESKAGHQNCRSTVHREAGEFDRIGPRSPKVGDGHMKAHLEARAHQPRALKSTECFASIFEQSAKGRHSPFFKKENLDVSLKKR